MFRKIAWFSLVVFVAIQFIRPARNNGTVTGPHDISHMVPVPDSVMTILKTSCYDCHSNHTEYPWYTNINAVGFWLQSHIEDGKRSINFSDLSSFTQKKLDHRLGDITEQLDGHEMPLSSYTLIHRYAILNAQQENMIRGWVVSAREALAKSKWQ